MSNFQYSKENINLLISDFNFSKVSMSGLHHDLEVLKTKIEELYDNHVFNMGYGIGDAPYFGWTGDSLKNMQKIDDEICKRFEELYAIILGGLGEKL